MQLLRFAAVAAAASFGAQAIRITSITFSGDGCPSNSASIMKSQNGDVATLIFDEFNIETDLDEDDDEEDLTCDIRVNLDGASGSGNAILKADIRGFTSVDRGIVGSLATSIGMNTQSLVQLPSTKYFSYPTNDDYLTSTEVSLSLRTRGAFSLVFRSILKLESQGRDGSGIITVDSIDLSFRDQ